MNKSTPSNNLSTKSVDELREMIKRFMRESSNNTQLLRDKLTGAQFKNIHITNKVDGAPWTVTVLASGKKVTVWQ
mgnify:CR=1 FL=1